MTLVVFGTFHFDTLLELSKLEDIEGWIEKSSTVKTVNDIMPSLMINEKKWLQYEQILG